MKKILSLIVLVFTFAVWSGCDSKNQESAGSDTDIKAQEEQAEVKKAEDIAAKRARIQKASEEKAEQRQLALLEKIKLSPTYTDASGRIVFIKAEVAPYYKGGDDEMMKYLQDNLIYPKEALEQNIEGIVFVDFVVDQSGNVREVVASDVVGDDVNISLKEESVRVVSSMPGWQPGLQQGKAVDASFSIPINFEILN